MRYDNWDVIVFARDSHIPIQEFKTACYSSQDEYGRQLSTLTCYIASLPTAAPFRISIHLWTGKAKPSAIIESRKKPNQRVVYTAQVIVDGARVFHDFYEFNSWPQEIVHEKRFLGYHEHVSSQRRQPLEFPAFHQNVLIQSSWDARENNGRIKLLLSEQLVSNTDSPSDLSFGETNDMVCFSFQHAPRDILEQAGISWPIRNPLYLAPTSNAQARPSTLQSPWLYTPSRNPLTANHMRSPLTKTPGGTSFIRPSNPEPFARPKTNPPPQLSNFPRPPVEARGRTRLAQWSGDTGNISVGISFDDMSIDTWSTKRSTSTSTTDACMPDVLFVSPPSLRNKNSFCNLPNGSAHRQGKPWEETRPPARGRDKHLVVTIREDQFGQLVEALSPPKRGRELSRHSDQECNPTAQLLNQAYPPKMATGVPIKTKPSAAAIARTASYPDFNSHVRDLSNKLSPTKPEEKAKGTHENQKSPGIRTCQGSFASGKESRVPTPFPFLGDTRVGTPYPFTLNQLGQNEVPGIVVRQTRGQGPVLSNWDSDISMRNPSSIFSSFTRADKRERQGRSSPVPTPNASGNVKSRKEGLRSDNDSPAPVFGEQGVRHDQSLLPNPQDSIAKKLEKSNDQGGGSETATANHHRTSLESMLNAGRQDQDPFVPGHRSGVDSLDSIGRVEKQLFSALGEELSFNDQEDTTQPRHDHTSQEAENDSMHMTEGLLAGLSDFDDSPLQKRKRNGTFGAERGRSPIMKIARELGVSGEVEVDAVKVRED